MGTTRIGDKFQLTIVEILASLTHSSAQLCHMSSFLSMVMCDGMLGDCYDRTYIHIGINKNIALV